MEHEGLAEALCGLHKQPTDSSATEDEDIDDILSFSAGEEAPDDTEDGMMTDSEEEYDTGDELDGEDHATPRASGSAHKSSGARYTAQKPGRFTGLNLEGPTGKQTITLPTGALTMDFIVQDGIRYYKAGQICAHLRCANAYEMVREKAGDTKVLLSYAALLPLHVLHCYIPVLSCCYRCIEFDGRCRRRERNAG